MCEITGSRLYEGWMRRYLGEILLIIDDQHIAEAQHWIEQAIEADERNQMMFHLGRDYAVYAELFKRKGDKDKGQRATGQSDRHLQRMRRGWMGEKG